ncbi:MAG: hypothetical protein CGW95_09695 [Phenylobacterium zucineum]|nr:MAG: hypothetical protein CGW95_09695 [Phenylobacterium zucineum]
MTYAIVGLPLAPFQAYFGLSEEALSAQNIRRVTATRQGRYPCRITLQDALEGETLLLLNHEYQSAETPYRGRHAIFVNERATVPARYVDALPPVLANREAISVRAFDQEDMMLDAMVVSGPRLDEAILRLFSDPNATYLHAHNAARGCFAARIDRA